ncbi:interleukin-1 receptor accessory protein-like 1 isoform X1 [Chiloscyllium plagiosum]|uniref:interleukin-1 receptor accessory protein-like 1 isoform X1 n=1 Tax=Chiloscyllium plagiosum TaxID=36176 RepID=UPI001CB808E9|nr:interleukin-1 receptor accessory protein-like 1 isoform X1 [Chiloscyllium plagiosum]
MLLNGLVSAYILRDGVQDPGSDAFGPPKIIVPTGTTVKAELGKSLKLTCQAITCYTDKFSTIIYWLANHEFIEDVFENSRVKEGQEIFMTENGKTLIQKYLEFTKVTPGDFKTNFTCAVLNPTGSSVKTITLGQSWKGKPEEDYLPELFVEMGCLQLSY